MRSCRPGICVLSGRGTLFIARLYGTINGQEFRGISFPLVQSSRLVGEAGVYARGGATGNFMLTPKPAFLLLAPQLWAGMILKGPRSYISPIPKPMFRQ